MSDTSTGGVERDRESWKPRPGNFFIMEGTWVRSPGSALHDGPGVVSNIESHGPESPRDGSINILWFPNSSEHLSAMTFFKKLRDGRLVVDGAQHPYDKVEWNDRSLDTDTNHP